MKLPGCISLAAALHFAAPGFAQQPITSVGGAVTQNFDAIGTSATAALPTGWKIGTNWSTGTSATTLAAGISGTGIIMSNSSGGCYQPNSSGDSIIYRSGMNPKIQRNFEVFSPWDFIARITQHIPDKSFQLVRYYGWYSNKMRGQRLKQTDAEPVDVPAGEVIDVSAFKPRRIPSKKWRELIKKVWEADPLLCRQCHKEMRIITLIDEAAVIERILRHLGLWEAGVRVDAARDPPEPAEPVIEPWLDDPFPNYENELVFAHN